MKIFPVFLFLFSLSVLVAVPVHSQEDKPAFNFKKEIEALIPGLNDADLVKRYGPQMDMARLTARAGKPGNDDERKAYVKALSKALGKDKVPQAAKVWMVRQLEHVGQADAVPALSMLLGGEDLELRETARRALEENPSNDATGALLSALNDPSDPSMDWRVGVLHSVGLRRDQNSVPGLQGYLVGGNPVLAEAAAKALAINPSPNAFQTLALAYAQQGGEARAMSAKALLDAATTMKGEGVPIPFDQMYNDLLLDESLPTATRIAALNRLGSSQPEILARAVRFPNPAISRAAIRKAVEQPSALGAMGEFFGDMPEAHKIAYLWAVADAGFKGGEPHALSSLEGEEISTDLGTSAIAVLGSLASGKGARRLLALASGGPGNLRRAAEHALIRLPGAPAAEAIESAAAEGEFRVTALKSIAKRGYGGDLADLVTFGADKDGGIAAAAMDAVGKLGGDAQVASLIDALKGGNGRALKPLREIVNRSGDSAAVTQTLLGGLDGASDKVKSALLGAVAVAGDASGLDALTKAANEAGTRSASLRALGEWPSFKAFPTLLGLAENKDLEIADHVMSVRGAMNMFDRSEDRPSEDERVGLAEKLMTACRRADERKQVVSVFGSMGNKGGKALLPLLDNDEVKAEAAATAITLAEKLKHKELAKQLAEKVAGLEISDNITKRAKKLLK